MRALTHPLRLQLLGLLRMEGPATASTLGDIVDESPALVSYHLRQLAQFDFVEEALELAHDGRTRWWRAAQARTSWTEIEFLETTDRAAAMTRAGANSDMFLTPPKPTGTTARVVVLVQTAVLFVQSVTCFLVGAILHGVGRALPSGPLEHGSARDRHRRSAGAPPRTVPSVTVSSAGCSWPPRCPDSRRPVSNCSGQPRLATIVGDPEAEQRILGPPTRGPSKSPLYLALRLPSTPWTKRVSPEPTTAWSARPPGRTASTRSSRHPSPARYA
ncbi:MAG: winged helix-turn-helix domain-containing protein [Actinomycetota bacterium]|nr:winged helix-turn-helix domain-containing protein [Actinomycetota bacterium]